MKKFYLMLAILVQVSVVFAQTHFKKGFVGAGYNQMSINIVGADIGGSQLDTGDEIAVFDGNLCVGAVELTQTLDPADVDTYPVISASADDGTGNGFSPGNKMYFRFWDISAGTEYHNVIPIVTDNGGSTITNAFAGDGTAFVNASTGNTTKTFNGAIIGYWGFPSNWTPAGVPEPNSDVVIPILGPANQPNIYPTDVAFCGSLTFAGASTLTIQSDGTGTGSLVVANGITGSATVNISRQMSGGAWHLISSSLSGQTIGAFLSANGFVSTNGASRGMMDYDEAGDVWSGYFENGTGASVSLGKGFGIRTDADNAVSFTGSLSIGDVTSGVSASGNGWNLIGNPYPSAIYAKQEVFGFLTENDEILAPSYKAIYLWDATANEGVGGYIVINSGEGQSNLASGQGFFVKAWSAGNVTFKQTMQVHETGLVLKSGKVSASNIVLKAKAGNISSSTKINFNEEMSLGLDPSYDAGILRSGNGFDIYSNLVEDNGVDFAIQWLPGHSTDSYIIPIGLDASEGGEVVFSAQTLNLPVGYEVMMEDRLANTQTQLKNGELYVSDLASGSSGVGRFYLHVGSSLQTGIGDIQQNDISVYTVDKNLYIKGNVNRDAQFMVYSIDGRLVNRFGAKSQNLNKLNVAGYTPGIYFVKVQDKNNYKSVKFVVGK